MERSDSPTRNGLSLIFSKTRNRGRDSEGNSSKSTDSEHRRGSLEVAIDKLKGPSSLMEEDGDHLGIKKLMPRSLASKRRRKKLEREGEQRMMEEATRGRSIAERGTLSDMERSYTQETNGSGDGGSSITYDSDAES